MSKRVVIAGAGGFGRGVHSWIQSSPRHQAEFGIAEIVFIDDAPTRFDVPVVGRISDYIPAVNDVLLCAVGDPHARQEIVGLLSEREAEFHTFVADQVCVGDRTIVGKGSIVCPGVVMSADVTLGEHVHVNFNCSIGHDTRIGSFATLSPMVNVMGEVRVGEYAFVGGTATVLPRLEVGSRATVGAAAVVTRSVLEGTTMIGNPAKPLGEQAG